MTKSHKFIFLAATCLFYCKAAQAQDANKLQFSGGAGYQRENFHWSIAGNINGQSPNVYSELKWKSISGIKWDAAMQWNFYSRFLLTGGYDRSSITSGTSNDTDYGGDNRTNPVYNQNFSSNKGSTSAWSAGLGYKLIANKLWKLTPYAGYGIHYQSYYLLGDEGSFGQLNTTYKPQWEGPFIRLTSSVQLLKNLEAFGDFTYNQVKYNAAADWNLIQNFQHPVSFRQAANGYGIDMEAGLSFNINRHLAINTGFGFFNWETGNGTDTLYLTSGGTEKTQMNGATRNGMLFKVGLNIKL
ncbi:MAG TPA: hypothetical protein VK671_17850 [Mucilaginibacter sp.]|jgi:hypothetical protein|nr:hypothetical protein [Mucilaginibacter sp.]